MRYPIIDILFSLNITYVKMAKIFQCDRREKIDETKPFGYVSNLSKGTNLCEKCQQRW